jgi:hypothetical protein
MKALLGAPNQAAAEHLDRLAGCAGGDVVGLGA